MNGKTAAAGSAGADVRRIPEGGGNGYPIRRLKSIDHAIMVEKMAGRPPWVPADKGRAAPGLRIGVGLALFNIKRYMNVIVDLLLLTPGMPRWPCGPAAPGRNRCGPSAGRSRIGIQSAGKWGVFAFFANSCAQVLATWSPTH